MQTATEPDANDGWWLAHVDFVPSSTVMARRERKGKYVSPKKAESQNYVPDGSIWLEKRDSLRYIQTMKKQAETTVWMAINDETKVKSRAPIPSMYGLV